MKLARSRRLLQIIHQTYLQNMIDADNFLLWCAK